MTTVGTVVRPRPAWRAIALPDEHGGWGLTAEPVLLGLLVAPSWAGAALAVAAFLAFLVRTPLKLVLVDRWRHRWLERSRLAAAIAAVELVVLVALSLGAGLRAGWEWLVPVGIAAPLVGVELWFDMRSRGRRLVPELCGAVGIAAAATSIALVGGADARVAAALWVVLAARAIVTMPFVRVQIGRLRRHAVDVARSDRAQVGGAALALTAIPLAPSATAGAIAVMALAGTQLVWVRRPPVPAKTLGLRQLALGLTIVAITALGVLTI